MAASSDVPEPDRAVEKGFFTRVGEFFEALADEVQQTIGDPVVRRIIREDMDPPPAGDLSALHGSATTLEERKRTANTATFDELVAEITALVSTFKNVGVVLADGDEDAGWDLFYAFAKILTANMVRVKAPPLYALGRVFGYITDEAERAVELEPAKLIATLRNEPGDDKSTAERAIQLVMGITGTTITVAEAACDSLGSVLDAYYGWDPAPGSAAAKAEEIAASALTLIFHAPDTPAGQSSGPTLSMTLIRVQGEPEVGTGLLVSFGGGIEAQRTDGDVKRALSANVPGTLDIFVGDGPQPVTINADPDVYLSCQLGRTGSGLAFVLGEPEATRVEIDDAGWGIELSDGELGARCSVEGARLVVVPASGDGFLRRIVGDELAVGFDVAAVFDPVNGLRLEGGTRGRVTIPIHTSLLGLLTVYHLDLAIGPGADGYDVGLQVTGAFAVTLGPFRATVDEIGLIFQIAVGPKKQAPPPALGILDVEIGFKPPLGIAMTLDAGVAKGGGYLRMDVDRGEYVGAMEVALELPDVAPIGVKVIALLSTRMPDGEDGWSLLLLVYAQTHVQLGFGFTLLGVGGMIGLQHRMDVEALMTGMTTGALDDILFPAHPVADAPRIIQNLRVVFPQSPGTLIVGPMLQIGWGTPTLVDIRAGVMFELNDALGSSSESVSFSRLVILGQLRVEKKIAGTVLLRLLADILVNFDFTERRFTLVARLRDSKVGGLTVSGMFVVAAGAAGDQGPAFILAAGGFNPNFKDLPPGLPAKIDRVSVATQQGVMKLELSGYFAVTTNSVQLGAMLKATGERGPIKAEGWLGFDALFEFEPRFQFVVNLHAGVTFSFWGEVLAGATLELTLSGPGRWRVHGIATVKLLLIPIDLPFDEQWGEAPPLEAPATNVAALLQEALSDVGSWSAALPAQGAAMVTLGPVAASAGELLVHPLGTVSVLQRVVPFGLEIEKFGTGEIEGARRFDIAAVTVGGKPAAGTATLTEFFAPGQFFELSTDEKLSRPSFERFPAGIAFASDAYTVPADSIRSDLAYETEFLEPPTRIGALPPKFVVTAASAAYTLSYADLQWQSASGAAATSRLRAADRLRPADSPVVRVGDPALALVELDSLGSVAGGELPGHVKASYSLASQQAAAVGAATGVACQVVEQHELLGLP